MISVKSVVFCVKIGNIFRQFSIKNADTSEQKNKIFKYSLTYFPKSSYENNESIFEDFFHIKSAGSSNYRGSVFYSLSLPEFIPGCTYTALLPGNLANLLLSLPSVCAYLLVCRGSGARILPSSRIQNTVPCLGHF